MIILNIFALSLALSYGAQGPASLIKKDITVPKMREALNQFMRASHPSRFPGTKGHGKAQKYLLEFLKKSTSSQPGQESLFYVQKFLPDYAYGKNLYIDDFKKEIENKFSKSDPLYKKWDRFTKHNVSVLDQLSKRQLEGRNLIWEKKGVIAPLEVLTFIAHYDTTAHDGKDLLVRPDSVMAGADNNASGVVALLKLIEVAKKVKLKRTIRVVFMDFHDLGLLGPRAYIQKYGPQWSDKVKGSEKLKGIFNVEAIGHDSKSGDKKRVFGNFVAYGRSPEVLEERALWKLLKKENSRSFSWDFRANGANSSGHWSFWQKGIPALWLTHDRDNDLNPRLFTGNDLKETLNLKTYHKACRSIVKMALEWATK